jgi:cytochrome P450
MAEFRQDIVGFFTKCAREYGDVVSFRLGPVRLYQLSHPDFIEQVAVADSARNVIKASIIHKAEPALGNGLLLSEGEFWMRQRRLLQPSFHRDLLDTYAGDMVRCTEEMLAGWRAGQTLDLMVAMKELGLAITVQTLLGMPLGKDADFIGPAVEVLLEDFQYRIGSPFAVPRWVPTPWNRRVASCIRQMEGLLYGLIARQRAAGAAGGDILSRLLRARDTEGDGSSMTDKHLRDEAMTMFLAGHEAVAIALAWTGYLLAHYPAVEEKLLAELRQVLGGRPPTGADVPKLVYTERVVTESMRLYPPAPLFSRETTRDIEVGGYHIPKGATVLMSQWVVQRDPRWFERPEEFDPDRWGTEAVERLPKCAYYPFGAGPRKCIAYTYSMVQLVLIMATMMPRFKLTLVPGQSIKPWPSFTLRPVPGIMVTLAAR